MNSPTNIPYRQLVDETGAQLFLDAGAVPVSLKSLDSDVPIALEPTQQQILLAVQDYAVTATAYDSDDNLTSITREINGVSQTKTLQWDGSGNLLSVSAWV
ncbi:hypothetical protein AAGS40_23320 [Paraburkholderia sp. PREW-6R]|uniref:hypothetical protein n=1 Tax=Paraburkholderia sp. PREW-6R TaxID=3141544 RepID=UPI0031F4C01A